MVSIDKYIKKNSIPRNVLLQLVTLDELNEDWFYGDIISEGIYFRTKPLIKNKRIYNLNSLGYFCSCYDDVEGKVPTRLVYVEKVGPTAWKPNQDIVKTLK